MLDLKLKVDKEYFLFPKLLSHMLRERENFFLFCHIISIMLFWLNCDILNICHMDSLQPWYKNILTFTFIHNRIGCRSSSHRMWKRQRKNFAYCFHYVYNKGYLLLKSKGKHSVMRCMSHIFNLPPKSASVLFHIQYLM